MGLLHHSAVGTGQGVELACMLVGVASDSAVVMHTWRSAGACSDRAWVAQRDPGCKRQVVVVPYRASLAVRDMHKEDSKHIRESTDLPHMGVAELVVAQEGRRVPIVVVAGVGLAGTSDCTVCLDMAK